MEGACLGTGSGEPVGKRVTRSGRRPALDQTGNEHRQHDTACPIQQIVQQVEVADCLAGQRRVEETARGLCAAEVWKNSATLRPPLALAVTADGMALGIQIPG